MRPTHRWIGVVRISKDRDNETSTESQEASIREWAHRHGHELVAVLVDKGRSAYKLEWRKRPATRKAVAMVEAGAADGVVSWKIDRACRNTRDCLELIDVLQGYGGDYASVTEPFDTSTPTGKMTLTVIAAMAELESATKADRSTEWHASRRKVGATPTGPRPYGYQREKNRMIVDAAEAAVVKRMAAAVLAGESLHSIVRGLNDDGVPSKLGRPWNRRGVHAILTGPSIAALREVAPGRYEPSDAWEPIVDRDTWDELRAVLLDPRRRNGPGPTRRWLLTGVAVCIRHPDTPMVVKTNHDGPRYSCPVCHQSAAAPKVEEAFTTQLLGVLDDRSWRKLQGRGRHVDTTALEAERDVLGDMFDAGEIDANEYRARLAAWRERVETANSEPVPLPKVASLRREWDGLDVKAKRLVVEAVATGVVIAEATRGANRFDNGRVRVAWAV